MAKPDDSRVSKKQETNSKGNRRGLSASSKENLKKGRINGGRTPGSVSLTTTLRHVITQKQADKIIKDLIETASTKPVPQTRYSKDGQPYEAYDAVEVGMWEKARDTILERLDGKVTQPLSNDPDNPVAFIINTNLPGMRNGKHKRD